MAKLSIVIPTYNRPNQIVARVGELLPQLGDDIELIIIDNCSPVEVKQLIDEKYPESISIIRHHRNLVNIGGNANICRCFELATHDWLWLLGDDDIVMPDAAKLILGEIHSRGHLIDKLAGFNFSTSLFQYPESREFNNLNDYCQFSLAKERFGNALFISSCVYQVAVARNYLPQAYQYMSSCAPQMIVALCSISNGYQWRVSPYKVVDWQPAAHGAQWNYFLLATSFPILIDIPGCGTEVLKFINGALGVAMWRPLFMGGVAMCFLCKSYNTKYWVMHFSKLFLLLSGKNKLKMAVLYVFALSCHWLPGFKMAVGSILKSTRICMPFDFNGRI